MHLKPGDKRNIERGTVEVVFFILQIFDNKEFLVFYTMSDFHTK